MFSFFRSRTSEKVNALTVDLHSHLLAGIDDGVATTEQALNIIRKFQELGYRKLITTPHVMDDYYRNDTPTIEARLDELKLYLRQQHVDFDIVAAAEYYLDQGLMGKLESKEPLLTFGNKYLLFETNMFSQPLQLNDFIFIATTSGYRPVLAHPERYAYMSVENAEDLRNRGVLFQINMLSLIGYYSKPIQKMAYKLIDNGWVDMLGSDCHIQEHVNLLLRVQENKYYQKALALPLLNNTL